jgi:hypothetical protein
MGENLEQYNEGKDGTVYYYYKNSVKRKSGIVNVWTEARFNGKNKEWGKMVDECKKSSKLDSINDCNKLFSRKDLIEINCKDDKCGLIKHVLYDGNLTILYSSSPLLEWDYIIPDSNTDELKNKVCQ